MRKRKGEEEKKREGKSEGKIEKNLKAEKKGEGGKRGGKTGVEGRAGRGAFILGENCSGQGGAMGRAAAPSPERVAGGSRQREDSGISRGCGLALPVAVPQRRVCPKGLEAAAGGKGALPVSASGRQQAQEPLGPANMNSADV